MNASTKNVVNVEAEVTASHLYDKSCTKINDSNIQNVANVEAEITVSHVHGRSCTEINNSNMDGVEINAVEIGSIDLSVEMDLEYTSDRKSSSASSEDMEEAKVIA